MDLHAQILQVKIRLNNLVYTDWITTDLFSTRWYGTMAFILFSYILCFWLLDKRRFTQILLFGSLMTVMVSLFDTFGTNLVLWSYLTRVFPIMPSLFLYDFTIVPLYYMLVYQYSPDWKTFALWNAVAAGIISFGFYPLLTALDMFELNNWRYAYFFPFTFTFGFIGRAVVLGVMAIEENRRQAYTPYYASNLTPQPAMKPLADKDEQNEDQM